MFRKSIGVFETKKIELILINLLFLSFASCINDKNSKHNSSNSSQLNSNSSTSGGSCLASHFYRGKPIIFNL